MAAKSRFHEGSLRSALCIDGVENQDPLDPYCGSSRRCDVSEPQVLAPEAEHQRPWSSRDSEP